MGKIYEFFEIGREYAICIIDLGGMDVPVLWHGVSSSLQTIPHYLLFFCLVVPRWAKYIRSTRTMMDSCTLHTAAKTRLACDETLWPAQFRF